MVESSSAWSSILLLSLRVGCTALLLSALLGIPLGAWLALGRFPLKRLVMAVVYTGMGMPPVVIGLVVYLALSRAGPLGGLNWLYTASAMIVAQTIIGIPLVAAITHAAVSGVPAELFQQVRALGASRRQAQWAVLVQARAGVVVALAAAFGRIVSEVGAALMVGGNIDGHTRILTTAIVLETGKGEFALALALGGWLLALALAANAVMVSFQDRPQS